MGHPEVGDVQVRTAALAFQAKNKLGLELAEQQGQIVGDGGRQDELPELTACQPVGARGRMVPQGQTSGDDQQPGNSSHASASHHTEVRPSTEHALARQ